MKKLLLWCMVLAVGWLNAQTNIANYGFSKSTGNAYVPITGGTKLFPTGTATTYDNSVSAAIALSSPFTYGGVAVSNVYISTNGFITFGTAPSTTNYTGLSTTTTSMTGAIAPFSQDGGGSEVTGALPEVSYLDTPTEFIVQWKDHANYFNRTVEKLNFQVHLVYATGEVKIIYGDCTNPGTVTTSGTTAIQVGIRGNDTTFASNLNNLMVGDVPTGTTCNWSDAVTGNANNSNMLFSGITNVNVKIPNGLQYVWTPGTQAPVRTFTAASAINSSGASLAWTAPSGATSYNVQYRVPGTCSWTDWTGNPVATNSVILSGLTQGTPYQVRVQAVNGSSQSIYSHIPTGANANGYTSTGTFTTLLNCSSTVTGLAATVTPDTAAISWTASTTAPANGYEYYYSTSSTTPANTVTPSGSTAAGIVSDNLTGLTPSTTYYFWVRGNCTATDKGAWSSSKSFATLGLCPTISAPTAAQTGVSANPTFTWAAIAGVSGYKINIGTAAGATDILNAYDMGNVTTFTLPTALNYGVKYYYTITAYTPTTATAACTERNFTVITLCPVVSAPTAAQTGVSTTPTFTWAGINGATGYKINLGTTPGATDVLNAFDMGNVTTYTLPNALMNGTMYYYTITGYSGLQTGSSCIEGYFTTVCLPAIAPYSQNFDTTPVGSSTSINAPTCWSFVKPSGSNSYGYVSTASPFSAPRCYLLFNNSTTSGNVILASPQTTNLSDGTKRVRFYAKAGGSSYTVQVGTLSDVTDPATFTLIGSSITLTTSWVMYTVNIPSGSNQYLAFRHGLGGSSRSVYLDDIVVEDVPSCLEPTALSSSAITYKSATISWTASVSAPSNNYDIYVSATNTAPTSATAPTYSNATSPYVMTPLNPSTTYYTWVRSNCGATTSPWISIPSFTTANFCPTVTALALNATGVSVNPTFTWSAMTGATGYKITIGTTSGGFDVLNAFDVGNVLTYTLPAALNNSTRYYYTINAYDAAVISQSCTVRSFTTVCDTTNVAYNLDFENVITPDLPLCTNVVTTGSGNTWTTADGVAPFATTTKVLRYKWNSLYAANTWFFTQGINLTAGTSYTIKYKYASADDSYVEKLKVAYGTSATVAGMTTTLANYPSITDMVIHSESISFTPTTSGVFYFGFQAYSGADEYYLMVDDINVDLTMNLATNETQVTKSNIKIYPNPFSDVLNISDVDKVKSISIMDTSGKMVKSFEKAEAQLRLSDLSSGMYIVILNMKDGSKKTIKAIKK